MAAGDVTQVGRAWHLSLLVARTTTNSAPSGASAGVALTALDSYIGATARIESASLRVWSTAGSDTMTCTIRLWGYDSTAALWFPLGTGAATTKGTINVGAAIDETSANQILHTEPVYQVSDFERLYVEVVAIGGTSTAISAALIVTKVSG